VDQDICTAPRGEAAVELASEAVFMLIGYRLAEAQKGHRR